MTEKMEARNPLVRLMKKFQQGTRPVTHMGPFLPLVRIKERGLPFNDIMRNAQAMTDAALLSFELGFESTVLPFDLNVEAEMLGARVRYHDGFDGSPVYPTIADKPFTPGDDIAIPDALAEKGRMPAILKTIASLRERARDRGAVGVFHSRPLYPGGPGAGYGCALCDAFEATGKSPEAFRTAHHVYQSIDRSLHLCRC